MENENYRKYYLSRDIPSELKLSNDHAESTKGLLGLLADEQDGKLQRNNANTQTPMKKVKNRKV